MLKLIEIVILWVYYTIPFWLQLVLAHFGHPLHIFETSFFFLLRITDEGSVPKNGVYNLEEVFFFIFQLLGECHCWWVSESPRAHVAKFYGLLRLIRSVLERPNFPC